MDSHIARLRRSIARCQEPCIRPALERQLEEALAERAAAKAAAKATRDAERAATKARREAFRQTAKVSSLVPVSPTKNIASGDSKYRGRTVEGKRLLAHRVAAGLEVGDKRDVHHIDHDVENNSPANLKTMTHRENCNLRRKRKGTACRFIGGSWDKSRGKWRFRVTLKNGSTKHLGYFDSEEEGRDVYNSAVVQEYGLGNKTINHSERATGTVWDIIKAVAEDTEYLFGQVGETLTWIRETPVASKPETLRDTEEMVIIEGILSQSKRLEDVAME